MTDSSSHLVKNVYDLRKLGWYCGECHDHVNHPVTLETLTHFLEINGIDFLSLCQGWLTSRESSLAHDGAALRLFIESGSSESLQLRMGAEFPKTRFGHTCWWRFPGMNDPYGQYDSMHDKAYFDVAGISEEVSQHTTKSIPFALEPPFRKIQRWKRLNGISMAPHPTSWWLTNPNASTICTNIAVDFCYDLLGERLYDTLAVMGYDAEHVFYQNLWFHLLNEGYRISAVAETDGDIGGKHKIGDFRTYAFPPGDTFDEDLFLNAIRSGRSFLTSGPILIAKLDGVIPPGSIIENNGKNHVLNVEAWTTSLNDWISWIVLYRNGKVETIIDIEANRENRVSTCFQLQPELERAWYVVKVYGKNRPDKKEQVDILNYAKLCEEEICVEYQSLDSVAFTNPFYFEPPRYKEPRIHRPSLTGRLLDDKTSDPIPGLRVNLMECDEELCTTTSTGDGCFNFGSVPLTAWLRINCGNGTVVEKSIHPDYPPLKKYFEFIYSGHWAFENKNLQPGQVPWNVFNFDKLRQIVEKLNWEIRI